MSIVIGDVHGCFKTFKALFKKLPEDQIILTGDLIDRGPRSKQMIDWVMKHPDICRSVMGNHEQFAITSVENVRFSQVSGWFHNGGGETLKSYYPKKSPNETVKLPKKHLEFLKGLPLFIEEGDLIVSHSSYSGYYDWKDVAENAHKWYGITWNRDRPIKINNKFHVFGHTPGKVMIQDFYACIDTGAYYKVKGLGTLTALQYPSMKLYQQENIDF